MAMSLKDLNHWSLEGAQWGLRAHGTSLPNGECGAQCHHGSDSGGHCATLSDTRITGTNWYAITSTFAGILHLFSLAPPWKSWKLQVPSPQNLHKCNAFGSATLARHISLHKKAMMLTLDAWPCLPFSSQTSRSGPMRGTFSVWVGTKMVWP